MAKGNTKSQVSVYILYPMKGFVAKRPRGNFFEKYLSKKLFRKTFFEKYFGRMLRRRPSTPKSSFLKCCSGGVWGAKPPQESPIPVPCPRGDLGGRSPSGNLRCPCLAPAGRRTDGEKSKNEPQGSYRPKNLNI